MTKQISQLDHVNFTVTNLKESLDWYNKVFNFECVEEGIDKEGNKWAIVKSGDSMLALTEFPNRKIYEGREFHQTYHFGLRLADKKEWENTMKEYSLKTFYSSPIVYPNSQSWYVKDPTGNEIDVTVWNKNEIKFA